MQEPTEKYLIDSILTLLSHYQSVMADRAAYQAVIRGGSLRNWKDDFLKNRKEMDELLDRAGFETLRAYAGKGDWQNFLNALLTALERFSADDRIG
jgi:hypothetical protein